jgi:predicted ATP-grasp superfamily ATP-dependent carboligase
VAKIDFKKDSRRGNFFVLEINARFNLWNYLGAACGVNIPRVAYKYLLGQPCKPQHEYRTGIKWLSFGNDLRAFLRDYNREGDLSWRRWLLSYRSRKVYDVFSWRDPYPSVITLLNESKGFCRHLAERVGK